MATPTILAHAADAPLPAMLERSLAPGLAQAGGSAGDRVTILLATKRLADSADEALIGEALEAWSEGRLLVVSVDGATPPLGLRDVERLDWTPGKDEAQLARIGDGLARLAANLPQPAFNIEKPSVATARAAAPRTSRTAIAVTAGLAAVLGLASMFFAAQFTRERAPSQVSAPPTVSPAPLPSPAPTGSPPLPGAAPRQEPAPAQPVTAQPASPDLSRPSGGGPAPPAAGPEPGAGLPEVVVTALLLVPALLALFVIFRLTRRRPKPDGAGAAASATAPPSAAAPASAPPPALDGAKRIFVSYSHQDIDRVDPIIAEIERLGHPVWIDRRELSGGPGWAGQIVRGLRAARTVVLMASRHAYASDQVVREMYLAMSEKKPIVPLELETAEIPDELQYILAPFQRHRLEGGDRSSIVRNALAVL